jgi:dienelactone hydrolase
MNRVMIVTLFVSAVSAFGVDDAPLAEYFRVETARIAAKPLMGIDSAETWKARRPELQRQLKDMLGLWPEPPRGDLKVEIRGTVERPDFVVERILYQSLPGLYVTGNVYRPKTIDKRLPAILYVCGHSEVKKDGVIYGNKAHYQHHAAWFATNGYVCLIVDTLQLGEVPGLHHGTARENMWWWQSRGYSPAGVEAWNAVRGIDYLVSRPDVDKSRIGVTGRSGGGATSWWVGAIDDRVAAVCPVAGITDLKNHVVDGVIEGHCDCMYFTNTERWDFPMVAALVAPKPMLIENTDKDPIFPEDGVRRIYAELEKVYQWYDAKDHLSLLIGKGGHADTVELRHPAFAFFEKHLKGKPDAKIEEPDRKVPIEDLKVLKLGEVLADSRNATIHETFVAKAKEPPVPGDKKGEVALDALEILKAQWLKELRAKTFAGWPKAGEEVPLDVKVMLDMEKKGVRLRAVDYDSQDGVRLRLWILNRKDRKADARKPGLCVGVFDEAEWKSSWTWLAEPDRQTSFDPSPKGPEHDSYIYTVCTDLQSDDLAVIVPRGVGPTAWDPKKDTQIRRRFALLGQTLAGMQAWDVRRGLAALRSLPEVDPASLEVFSYGNSASITLWASVFEPTIKSVNLGGSFALLRGSPALLNIDRIIGIPQYVSLMHPRKVVFEPAEGWFEDWAWPWKLAMNLTGYASPDRFLHFVGEN